MAETKKIIKKAVTVKPKPAIEKTKPEAKTKKQATGLTAEAYDLTGKSAGTVALPEEIFGQAVNANLIAQAIRVYQTNISTHTAHTKTRGEVRGGGVKPWRQKGTGRARSGSKRSPIWVGGGKVFGPRFHDVKLNLPQKMKHKALICALSSKAKSQEIKVITGFEKIDPKTKIVSNLIRKIGLNGSTLLVISQKNENLKLATRNLKKVSIDVASNLNAFEILSNRNILFAKESIEKIK